MPSRADHQAPCTMGTRTEAEPGGASRGHDPPYAAIKNFDNPCAAKPSMQHAAWKVFPNLHPMISLELKAN